MIQAPFGVVMSAGEETWKYQVEYFKSVTMNCDDANTTATTDRVLLWVLPSGQVIRPNDDVNVAHIFLKNDGRNLVVDRVDDDLFGLYLCIVDVDNGIKVVKQGLNIDGAYYDPEHDDRIKHNAMIGGICAGGALLLIVSVWIIRAYCCKKKKNKGHSGTVDIENGAENRQKEVSGGINNVVASVNNVTVNVTNETDTLEKIYDQADGILAIMKHRHESNDDVKSNKSPISLMDSGEYHTIADFGFESLGSSTRSGSIQAVANANAGLEDTLESQTSHGMSEGGIDVDKLGVMADSLRNSNEGPLEAKSNNTAKPGEHEKEVIYAIPNKPKRKENVEKVVIVEGDLVIEENGAKIVVTSSPPTPSVASGAEDVVNRLTDNLLVTSDRNVLSAAETSDFQTDVDVAKQDEHSHNGVASGVGQAANEIRQYDGYVSTGSIDYRL